ncbi:hypothetical protein H0H92_012763 [Tricholoma furcatifolium]|nr:hypothetical protein H0H92_012763 [Tricholoma furcatifolium]
MSHPTAPTTLVQLKSFQFEKLINEDPFTHSLTLLGSFPAPPEEEGRVTAIVRVEKTALDPGESNTLMNVLVDRVELEQSTDIYTWFFGWLGEKRDRDIKINIICPATEVHIRKYTRQEVIMVKETPESYEKIVKPYIAAFPKARTQWVDNILLGLSEQDKVLYSSEQFLILPDMKWDLKTISSLYLLALVRDESIRSLRDLRKKHIPLLQAIYHESERIVAEKWGLSKGSLRMYIHYQPSYYHFHVHIVNANQAGMMGMAVGQAHLLDDVISLLELEPMNGPSIFEQITLTYGLGDQHGLFEAMQEASL